MLLFLVLAVFAFFALGTILFIVANVLGIKQGIARHRNVAAAESAADSGIAAAHGWAVVRNPGVDFFPNSRAYSLFGKGGKIFDLFHKQINGVNACVFNYKFVVYANKSRFTHAQTVVAFQSPALNIPYFSLSPEPPLMWLNDALGGRKDIDFPAHPNFSKRYTLESQDEANTRRLFNPRVISFFDNSPTLYVDGGGNCLFIYLRDAVHPIENFDALVGDGLKILRIFQV